MPRTIGGPHGGSTPRLTRPASERATVRLSTSERQRAEEAAKVNRQTLSDFVRDAIVTAAEDCLEEPADRPTKS